MRWIVALLLVACGPTPESDCAHNCDGSFTYNRVNDQSGLVSRCVCLVDSGGISDPEAP